VSQNDDTYIIHFRYTEGGREGMKKEGKMGRREGAKGEGGEKEGDM